MGENRIARHLSAPVDGAGLAAFRVLFGLLMCAGLVRFLFSGWIERFYGEPTFFFKYWGFAWIEVPPVAWIDALTAALALLALLIALGLFYRLAALLFFVGFTYLELFDVTNYLNHYYLVSLLALLLAATPTHRCWSLDARRRPRPGDGTAPRWALYLIRFQVAVVYLFAGLAKLQPDWLLHAQPLNLWLTARTETALIGPLLDELWVAYAASWFGFLFDTTIVGWLLWRRTRAPAYAVLLGFHFLTAVFFNIGMFPFIMTVAATVFFDPSWPRRFAGARLPDRDPVPAAPGRWQRLGLAVAAGFCVIQLTVPLRHFAYPGDVLWNEQGMRWAWKVMVREKHGAVTYTVRFPDSGKELQISPRRYLDSRQEREMAGQPDLILQLAHHIRDDFRRRGHANVEVRAEALVSLNGRPARHMIDPRADLARVEDDLAVAAWILPRPTEAPIQLGRRGGAR